MESARSATYHTRAFEALYALAQTLGSYDGIVATLRDREVRVQMLTGDRRTDTITCAPRPSDRDQLWFWTSERQPIREADAVTDAALAVAALLRDAP